MTTNNPSTQTLVLDFDLWLKVEQRALKLNISRDRLIQMAISTYLEKNLLDEEAEAEDARYLRAIRSKQARALARSENEE